MNALQQLSDLSYQNKKIKFPSVPEYALVKDKFSKDTNGLTKCIMSFLQLKGHYAVRVNTQGQYHPHLKKWIHGSTRRGTADIHATIKGRHVSIEIKVGRDKQSDAQRITQQDVEAEGGLYFIAHTFEEFIEWYHDKIKGGESS